MNIQTVRQSLKDWLSALVRIDSFDADPPASLYTPHQGPPLPGLPPLVPANTCIFYPVKNLTYSQSDAFGVTGEGEFTFSIVYRYPGDLTLNELPISNIESVVQYVQANALLNLSGCGGVRRAYQRAYEFPVQVERESNDQGDWLIYANIRLVIEFALTSFEIDPIFANPPEEPPTAENLTANIYRAKVKFDVSSPSDYTLDRVLTFDHQIED